MRLVCLAAGALLSIPAAPAVRAQELLQQAFGSASDDLFGCSIAAAGPDLDGDGIAEIAVGALYADFSATKQNSGAIHVLSGATLARLLTIYGTSAGDALGTSVVWCADADGDGLADLAGASRGTNSVGIWSSASGKRLRTLTGGRDLGPSLADAGDMNGDGIADLLVGDPGFSKVRLYSGKDGALLRTITGTAGDQLGYAVGMVGDVDLDGVADLGAGAPAASGAHAGVHAGMAFVFSGADGSVLQHWTGASADNGWGWEGDALGVAIGAAGDLDGDGQGDVWMAARSGAAAGAPSYLQVCSGATGATLRTLVSAYDWQYCAGAVGDLNGDGLPELGGAGYGTGDKTCELRIFSSRDGKVLWLGESYVTSAPNEDEFGTSLSPVGDWNGDGLPDFLVGARRDDTIGRDAGRVDLLAGNDLWLSLHPDHAKVWDNVTLTIAEGPTGNLAALFLTGVNGSPTFQLVGMGTFDAAQQLVWSDQIPPGLAGVTVSLRAFAIDARRRLVSSVDELLTFL